MVGWYTFPAGAWERGNTVHAEVWERGEDHNITVSITSKISVLFGIIQLGRFGTCPYHFSWPLHDAFCVMPSFLDTSSVLSNYHNKMHVLSLAVKNL